MNESAHSERAVAAFDASPDAGALMISLCTSGAAQFDPVRWHYLEVLAERAAAHQGSAKHMLVAKLAQALGAFKERFDLAHSDAKEAIAESVQHYPHATKELQQLCDAGDFKEVHRLIAKLRAGAHSSPLHMLLRQLDQYALENTAAPREQIIAPRTELKAVRNFRNTWAKLSVDKQVAQALEQAPKNAGPINSHMLVLRSLALMRDISPGYLNRFMSYADTLLCLHQGEKVQQEKPKKRLAARKEKK